MTALVVSAVLMLSLTMVQSTSVMASLSQENPYAIGAPILALKLTRMQMLTSTVGVGVAPITTLGGALVRAYLVRTSDAGATWTVSGDLPNGVYPWTTAFSTVRDGYVISAGATLFTSSDAGATWHRAFNVARTGVGAVVGNTGEYLWNLSGGTLVESSDAGRTWVDQPIVKYGTNGVVVTFGAHDAWHVVTGRGIYRTLDGTDWTLLK